MLAIKEHLGTFRRLAHRDVAFRNLPATVIMLAFLHFSDSSVQH